IRRRLSPRRGLFNNRLLLLRRPPNDVGGICCHVLILLRCFALEHTHLRVPPGTHRAAKAVFSRFERALTQSLLLPARRALRLGRHLRIGLRKTELPPRWRRRMRAILCVELCQGFDFPTIPASAAAPVSTPVL